PIQVCYSTHTLAKRRCYMKFALAFLMLALVSLSASAGHYCPNHGHNHNNYDDGDTVIVYTSGECNNSNASCYYKKSTYEGCEIVDGDIDPGIDRKSTRL